MKCKHCGSEIKKPKLFKSKVLNLELTQIQDWDKPYNEIEIPKGFRLIKVEELWKLLDSKEADSFLGNYKGEYNWFHCAQTKNDKREKWGRRLCLGRGLNLSSDDEDLASSYGDGRVVFVLEDD